MFIKKRQFVFCESLLNNQHITTLDLSRNDLSKGNEENLNQLVKALLQNKTLSTLKIIGNGFKSSNFKVIEMLEKKIENIKL